MYLLGYEYGARMGGIIQSVQYRRVQGEICNARTTTPRPTEDPAHVDREEMGY